MEPSRTHISLRKQLSRWLRGRIKLMATRQGRAQARLNSELERLSSLTRYTATTSSILGSEIELVDAASFVSMYREIFERQIYRFVSHDPHPYIVDAGANIGLSTIYFKQLYPQAEVVVFEPDRRIAGVLRRNLERFRLSDITLVDKALWSSETTLQFAAEGADGGRLGDNPSAARTYAVQTTRLRPYLERPVALLKIDVEGAETEVLQDCRDLLGNVANLFVEYHSMSGQPQKLPQLLTLLADNGFRLHVHAPFVISDQPLYQQQSHMGMDLQLNIYGFRPT